MYREQFEASQGQISSGPDSYIYGSRKKIIEEIGRCNLGGVAEGVEDVYFPVLDPYTEYVTSRVEEDGIANALRHYGLI